MKLTLKPPNAERAAPAEVNPVVERTVKAALNVDLDTCDREKFFCQYPFKTEPQPVRLELDTAGRYWVDVDTLSMPPGITYGRTRRWTLPAGILPAEVKRLVAGAEPFLERVHAGHSVEWDGNEVVGRLTADARQAAEDLQAWIDNQEWTCVDAMDDLRSGA